MTSVPTQYQQAVATAAAQLGIPESVVASQLSLESSWNPNAVSSTGAEGLAQFEPGTWATYGSGSPFDPGAAIAAYVKYMSVLLQNEGGSVRNALAAYNAGPGDLSAGYGYADTILADAGISGTPIGTPTATSLPGGGTAAAPVSTQTSESVNTGPGTTCAFALGTHNKVLIWHLDFSVCIISKTEARAIIAGALLAGGVVVSLVGMALVMQYALDKSGMMTTVNQSVIGGLIK